MAPFKDNIKCSECSESIGINRGLCQGIIGKLWPTLFKEEGKKNQCFSVLGFLGEVGAECKNVSSSAAT